MCTQDCQLHGRSSLGLLRTPMKVTANRVSCLSVNRRGDRFEFALIIIAAITLAKLLHVLHCI